MPNLPVVTVPERDAVLVTIALLETSPYSEANGGNVVIRAGRDVTEDIPVPALIITHLNDTVQTIEADGMEDRVDESVQIDAYASSEAQVQQLKYEADRILLENRVAPGGASANVYAFLLPTQWTNNDALSQADGLRRRTLTINLIRHRGGIGGT